MAGNVSLNGLHMVGFLLWSEDWSECVTLIVIYFRQEVAHGFYQDNNPIGTNNFFISEFSLECPNDISQQKYFNFQSFKKKISYWLPVLFS